MKEQLIYRKGSPADAEQLRRLGLLSYGRFREVLGEEGWKKMEAGCGNLKTYTDLLQISQCFVCEDQGTVVGMAFLIPHGNPYAFFEEDWAYIRLVGVLPAYAGKGIGRILTEQCVAFARDTGEQLVALHTSEFQDAARHIYESMGFKKWKALEPIFGKKYWLYHLPLGSPENITYHRAGAGDAEVLTDLRMQFIILLDGLSDPVTLGRLRDEQRHYFERILKEGSTIWIIARAGDRPVGIGGLLIRDNPPTVRNPSGKGAFLVNIFTQEEFRRRGISRTIIQKLEDAARPLDIKFFELHATRAGERVYGNLGYELHGEPTYRKYLP